MTSASRRALLIGDLSLLGLGGLFLAALAVVRWVHVGAAVEADVLRIALTGSLLLLAWGLLRWIQRVRAGWGWGPGRQALVLILALTILIGWPTLLLFDVRAAGRARAAADLCVLVERIDQVGWLGVAGRPARAEALTALRRQAERDQDGPALEGVVVGVLQVGTFDPELVALKHDAAQRLASLARTSADPFLLASLAGAIRRHGWENDPDCAPLLEIWHQRTDAGPL